MRNRHFPNYPNDTDYTTNSPSYYDDLARKQHLIKLLSKRIWEYEKTLDESLEHLEQRLTDYIFENDSLMSERLENWDKRIDEMPEEMRSLFIEWLNDGTLEQIINHDVLGNKADQVDLDKTNEILKRKANKDDVRLKGVSVGLNDFDEATLEAIQGGEGTEFHLEGMVRDKTVSPRKTTFIETSSNLFDKSKAVSGTLNELTGELEPHNNYWSSDYIPVKPNTEYVYDRFNKVIYYDNNFERIGNVTSNQRPTMFETPSNAIFIRLSAEWVAYLDEAFVGEGTEYAGYEPFYQNIKEDISFPKIEDQLKNFSGLNIENETIGKEKTNFIQQSSNLYNKHTVQIGKTINQNGQLVDHAETAISDFIKVEPNTTYILNGAHTTVFYRNDKSFISRPTNTGVFTTGNNVGWVRLLSIQGNVDIVQLNKGDELLPYEPFNLFFDGIPLKQDSKEEINSRKTYYFTPSDLLGYYEPSESIDYGQLSNFPHQTSVQDVYNKFEVLVSEGFLEKELYGYDETSTYPVYKYSHNPETVPVYFLDNGSQSKKLPKITLVSGLHGDEKNSIFSVYYLMYDIFNNWKENEILEYLRWNVRIEFIPLANPYGFTHGQRQNANGIDLNRNWNPNFVISDPSSATYGGEEPFSEVETQYIKRLIDENKDSIYFGDYHTNGTSGNDYGELMWHENLRLEFRSENIDISSRQLISELTRKFIERYDLPSDKGFFGYVNYSNSPMVKTYASSQGIESNLFECFRKFPTQDELYNDVAIKACTEYLGNWLGILLKQFKQVQ